MSKKDGTKICHSNSYTFLQTLASRNVFGIWLSTSLHLQIAQTTTLIHFSLAPYKIYAKYNPFYLQFGFLHLTQMDVNNTTQKVNRVKMLHTMHNYLFVQHYFQHTNPIINMSSRLQYANTKLTSPYYMNYTYIIQPNYCEGTLLKFYPMKNYISFSPLYDKTNRPSSSRSSTYNV